MIDKMLDSHPDLQEFLFCKGYLITDDKTIDFSEFPFYGRWKTTQIGNYLIITHEKTQAHFYVDNETTYFLLGHAFNPFSMETSEKRILQEIALGYQKECRPEVIDELTGIFILGSICGNTIRVELDCSGMQYGCYGKVNEKIYIASHMRLPADICKLETDTFVERLINYRWYRYMMGNYLPGELTCCKELKRIIPNTTVYYDGAAFFVDRFYPNQEIIMCRNEKEYNDVIHQACEILQNTMRLIPQKWKHPAISLTGGIDSNTTFAAANGVYSDYETFSYVSMYRESVDAEAAQKISNRFNVKHTTYLIPNTNEEIEDFDIYKTIFSRNAGDIGSIKDDDTRKKITLIHSNACDVEVKSWVSETIRAYAYKYFGRSKMPKNLSPRNYTSLYKIFFLNRHLACQTDRFFEEYLQKTDLKAHLFNYDESDFFVWEMMHGGKCGLNIGVMKACFDITIPYNNRKLLDLLLRVPLEKRISDQHHLDMKRLMNRELSDMNIRVVNLNETEKRKKMANLYFAIHSLLPF